jgi:hypothetical protein
MDRNARSPKGFLFEADDTLRPVVCRDVRGFPGLAAASLDRSMPVPDRFVIIVPDIAMEEWLAHWAEDVGHARRSMVITRRTDGQQIRLVGTLLAYGYGVDTSIHVDRLEHGGRAAKARPLVEEAPKVEIPDLPLHRKVATRKRVSR